MGRGPRRCGAALALFALTCGCAVQCDGDPAIPDPLTCDNSADDATIEALELATGPHDPPTPLVDGDPTYAVVGAQGSLMITLRAIWRGPDAPACGRAAWSIRHPETGTELASESLELLSSPSQGARVSGETYFVVETWPAQVDVTLEMYDVSVTRRLVVGGYELDAGVEVPDAGSDAGATDGAVTVEPDAG